MARRSQCSSAGDNPLDPNYLPPHYREEYRLAVDALVEDSLEGYYQILHNVDVVDFLSTTEIQYIQSSVQPAKQSILSEQQFLESDGEGSSDTYWPIHSDLDVPGLDLGWPQVHHFIEPAEVTTLVNPPEPDMPSIKEQARRLIKNAQQVDISLSFHSETFFTFLLKHPPLTVLFSQLSCSWLPIAQVVAMVMDMFTDVDIFADILNAAGRRVAVYILLDEHNADHFVNMVANCRVNLQAFPVSTAHFCSECYTFMWSFEKLHRCMAHLFLGQLVTTFDEEFRILFAQSQPLNVENMLSQMEDLSILQKRQIPSESTALYREPKGFQSLDIPSDSWGGHSYEEQIDGNLRIMALKRQGSLRGPADVYNRFAPQQPRMDPGFDQGPSRMLMMDNPALKRHSYAEDVPGRYSFPFLPQQGMPEPEQRGKLFHRDQQPYPGPGPEEEYSSHDKFWNQGHLTGEQYLIPSLQQEVPLPEFDPGLNYLSSNRNPDFDQGSDKLLPPADLPFTSPHPKRLGIGQPYVCQTSPTASNCADQRPFFHDPTISRKDPTVKQKLRNWRIGSYLSAFDNPEDEGLPTVPTQPSDPFEEHLNLIPQTAPGTDLTASKIPNVKEFKVTGIPRVSQMPSYAKAATQDKPKKFLDEPALLAAETKTTPTLSETPSTAEGRKTEEEDQKQPKNTVIHRDDSFRRKYNAAMQRSSRLRSSLIFSSLEQQTPQETTTAHQDDDGSDKRSDKTEHTKPPLVSQVLGQKRSAAREPYEWSRYIKSTPETLKPDDVGKKDEDKHSSSGKGSQGRSESPEAKEPLRQTAGEQVSVSPSMPRAKFPEAEAPKTDLPVQPTKPLLRYVDMNDPDNRLMFFKELAAKRKVAKAAEALKEKEKAELKPQPELKNKEKVLLKEISETSIPKDLENENSSSKDSNTSKTSNEQKTQPKTTEVEASLSVSAETDEHLSKPLEDPTLSNTFVQESLSPLIPRSKPTKAELPKINQPLQLTSPLLTAPLYVDMSDADNRLMFFKELAAKRKASEAKKGKEKAPMKPQAELQNPSGGQNEQNPPKGTLESVKPSIAKDSSVKNTTVSTDTSDSASSSLKDDENARKQDSLFKNDSSAPSTSERAVKVSAQLLKTDLERQSADETKTSQSKSPEHPTVSETSVEGSPEETNAAHTAISSHAEDVDKRECLTSENVSDLPSSVENSSSSDPQNTESFQLETNICSSPPPSEAESTLELGSFEPPISTSDTHPLDSDSQNHPVAAEETLFSDSPQDIYSSTNVTSTPPPDADEIKSQEPVSSSQQETSESSKEPLQNSDSRHNQAHLDAVPQSASFENTSVADAANVESDVSPDKKAADLQPNKLNSTTETNGEESSAATPSVGGLEKNVPELEQEESAAKEHEALESPDSRSPAVCPPTPNSSLLGESCPEGSVSEPHLEKTISSITAPGDTQLEAVPSETGSLENTASCNASQLEKTEPPQDAPMQTDASSNLKLTDLKAPLASETLTSSSMSESDQSVLDTETKKSETSVSAVPNLSDTNSISNETQPKSEESLVQPTLQSLSSPSKPTTVATAEADLPCKTSEAVTPECQTPETPAPQESSKKESESVETYEKNSNNLEDKHTSQKPSTEESAHTEKTKQQSNQSNCSETATSKQPKSSQSRYHSSTVNVLSSSNLRDDTKLLLEQISANSQSRNEATKESPVTDDEKEDKADKNAKNEKELGYKTCIRGQTKSIEEREKLLERIQSMRKERKVYSRFEVGICYQLC
ncbi:hypothetical protein XENOCAPTIV_022108 [Xenoophorus captivus]|uniref:Scaffolding anchor of CK1 domain-containing protein n=1 Tax=Xenoophorus captivus TaxID=1517983 RepID=A0ABV0QW58_9TELE